MPLYEYNPRLLLGHPVVKSSSSVLSSLQASVQIALCHLFFNLSGILLFYPLPFMRWPLTLCKILGRTTANYRWFAIFYLIIMFFALPSFVLGLSLAGTRIFFGVMGLILVTMALVIVVNIMQVKVSRGMRIDLMLGGLYHRKEPYESSLIVSSNEARSEKRKGFT